MSYYLSSRVLTGGSPVVCEVGQILVIRLTASEMVRVSRAVGIDSVMATLSSGSRTVVLTTLMVMLSVLFSRLRTLVLMRNRCWTRVGAVLSVPCRLTLWMCLSIDISTTPTILTLLMMRSTLVSLSSRAARTVATDLVVATRVRKATTEKLRLVAAAWRPMISVCATRRRVESTEVLLWVVMQTVDRSWVRVGVVSCRVTAATGIMIRLLLPASESDLIDLSILIMANDRVLMTTARLSVGAFLNSLVVAVGLSMVIRLVAVRLVVSKNWLLTTVCLWIRR